MADFRGMNRGGPPGPPPNMVRPIGPGPPPAIQNQLVKPPVFPCLCPDFMKGVCSVFQCPKNHPEASLLFCQAYQRDCCQQGQGCSYMHATAEEEQYYKDTGLIPLRFMNKPIRMERGKGPLPNGQPSLFPTDTPPTPGPVDSFPAPGPPEQHMPTPEPAPPVIVPEKIIIKQPDIIMEVETLPVVPAKRQKLTYEELDIERNMLKEKVKILEKKVEQLDAANDVLLEKNAKLRTSSKKSPERRRSPDHRSRSRRDGDRSRRSRSKERARSKDTQDSGNWKDNQNRGGGGGGTGTRWGSHDQYSNNNSTNNSNPPHSNHSNRGPL